MDPIAIGIEIFAAAFWCGGGVVAINKWRRMERCREYLQKLQDPHQRHPGQNESVINSQQRHFHRNLSENRAFFVMALVAVIAGLSLAVCVFFWR